MDRSVLIGYFGPVIHVAKGAALRSAVGLLKFDLSSCLDEVPSRLLLTLAFQSPLHQVSQMYDGGQLRVG